MADTYRRDVRTLDVPLGCPVMASDGAKLGIIKETSGSYFKVDARFQADYWLSLDTVISNDGEQVTVNFTRGEAGDHKLGEPGLEPDEQPMPTTPHAVIGSEEEQREQREKMERELEEQRQNLPGTTRASNAGEGTPGGMAGTPTKGELERDRGETSEQDSSPFPDRKF